MGSGKGKGKWLVDEHVFVLKTRRKFKWDGAIYAPVTNYVLIQNWMPKHGHTLRLSTRMGWDAC